MSIQYVMPKIQSYKFGEIIIDGQTYRDDVIILSDRVIPSWWRKEGHSLDPADLTEVINARPDTFIMGCGAYGVLRVPQATRDFLEKQGIKLVDLPTAQAVETFNSFQGGNIAGAGLFSIMFINLDFLRQEVQRAREIHERFRNQEDDFLGDPAPAALEEDEALDITEAFGLPTRLTYLSYDKLNEKIDKATYMAARFDVLMQHEFQHLVDARRFFPFWKDLVWKISQFVIRGFSSFNVEAWFEERAQLFALCFAEDSHAALSEIAKYLRGPSIRSPHQKGYRDLMQRIVEYVFDRPDLFPQIDRKANLVHQLHRLSREEIRSIARDLLEDEGLNDPI